jgi:hypothetical protein
VGKWVKLARSRRECESRLSESWCTSVHSRLPNSFATVSCGRDLDGCRSDWRLVRSRDAGLSQLIRSVFTSPGIAWAGGVRFISLIESAAYLNSYNPANLCQNYLGDSGVVGLGTTVPNASYSFTVPGNSNFVVVVNTTGTTTSSEFSGTVSGFFDTTPGPGPCPSP